MGTRLAGGWPGQRPDVAIAFDLHPAPCPDRIVGTQHPLAPPPSAVAADVAIIDGDDGLRDHLGKLLQSVGMQASLFAEPAGLLERGRLATIRCLLMDVRMRGANGLDFQARLLSHGIQTPVVFMTAHGDIPMAVRAIKAGAVDFLTKPLRDQDVLDAVAIALDRDHRQRQEARRVVDLRTRLASLTAREHQILLLATAGLMNKQIAAEIALSEVTVKMHRSSLMRKMGARTAAELVRMASALELPVPAGMATWHGPND
jgi:FixJ family two-component response regulator